VITPKEVAMPLSVKRITLWRADVENQPGVLAGVLEPLAAAGADLRVVMGYRFPTTPERSAVELYPVGGRRVTEAARQRGLAASDIPCLLVEGDNRPGWGAEMARAVADAGINIAFVMAQVIGRRFAAVLGLENDAAAAEAMKIIKKTGAAPRAARKTGARRR
jgi:hypothetical protein